MKRRAHSALPFVRLNRGSHETLQVQLCEILRAAIADLGPGARLPSTRAFADELGVSRNTVLNVYEELVLEGLLTSKTGSGTRVRGAPTFPARLDVRWTLRQAQYPASAVPFRDPDGHPIYLHR